MKNNQKNWLIAGGIILALLILGYFGFGNTYSLVVENPKGTSTLIRETQQFYEYKIDFTNSKAGDDCSSQVSFNFASTNGGLPEDVPLDVYFESTDVNYDDLIVKQNPCSGLVRDLEENEYSFETKKVECQRRSNIAFYCKWYGKIKPVDETIDTHLILPRGSATIKMYKEGYAPEDESPKNYYRLENNQCTTVFILPSQKTISDYETYSECKIRIIYDGGEPTDEEPTQDEKTSVNIFLGIFGLIILIGGLIFIYIKSKRR